MAVPVPSASRVGGRGRGGGTSTYGASSRAGRTPDVTAVGDGRPSALCGRAATGSPSPTVSSTGHGTRRPAASPTNGAASPTSVGGDGCPGSVIVTGTGARGRGKGRGSFDGQATVATRRRASYVRATVVTYAFPVLGRGAIWSTPTGSGCVPRAGGSGDGRAGGGRGVTATGKSRRRAPTFSTRPSRTGRPQTL